MGNRENLWSLLVFLGRGMRGFVMYWDAHAVMAVPRHQPGPAGEGCSGLYCCLPPLVAGVSGQPLPPHSGHPKLWREDPLRVGSLQAAGRAGIGAGDPAAPTAPNLGQGTGKSPAGSSGRWGWVGRALVPSPSLEGRRMPFGSENLQRRLPWQQAAWQSSSLQPR